MIEVQGAEIGAVLVIALPLDAVRAVRLAEVAGIGNFHLIGIVAVVFRLSVAAGSQEKRAHRDHKGPYN